MKLKSLLCALIAGFLTFNVLAQPSTAELQQAALDVLSILKAVPQNGISYFEQQELLRFHTNTQNLVMGDLQQEAYILRIDANTYMQKQQSLDKFEAQLRLDEKRSTEMSEADQMILVFKADIRLKLHLQALGLDSSNAQIKTISSTIKKMARRLGLNV